MKVMAALTTLATLVPIVFAQTISAAEISGNVTERLTGGPQRGVHVELRDALNAEILAETDTDFDGDYQSGLIPSGSYRIRFIPTVAGSGECCVTIAYFGASSDEFCSGSSVFVAPTALETVDHVVPSKTPTLVVIQQAGISGIVTDSSTGDPLPGIQVHLVHPLSAMALGPPSEVTGEEGTFRITHTVTGIGDFVVRFVDPTGAYFPEFFGAGGSDDYCLATRIPIGTIRADVAMARLTPTALTEDLLEEIATLPVPEQVATLLGTPLQRATSFLSDGNPNNDGAVCHQLDSFITRVLLQEGKGQIAPDEAAALEEGARQVQAELGCG